METRRADLIAQELEGRILHGDFRHGDRLDEVRLAEEFGVSRTPVREAFQRLALSGLIEQLPRRGVFVREPGPVELLEMFEVMAEIEAVCARLAATRISDAALEELSEANTRCSQAVADADTDRYYAENETFHTILYRESGNSFLASEAQRLHKRLRPFRRIQLQFRGRMTQSMAEHDAIVAALAKGDGEAAAREVRDHVAVQGEKFHQLVASLRAADE